MERKESSRKLTPFEYFETLQLEYLVAQLRHRIYPSKKDKAYYSRVMEGKKRIIEDIATRNQLPTIFYDSDKRRAFEDRIYNTSSTPNFFYKDETHRGFQEYFDLSYFYAEGTEVCCEIEGEVIVGVIKKYTPHSKEALVLFEDKEKLLSIPLTEIRRVL